MAEIIISKKGASVIEYGQSDEKEKKKEEMIHEFGSKGEATD